MITAMAVVRAPGGDLKQFSVASLIIALGIVVDNAIIVSDNSVRPDLRKGVAKLEAVARRARACDFPFSRRRSRPSSRSFRCSAWLVTSASMCVVFRSLSALRGRDVDHTDSVGLAAEAAIAPGSECRRTIVATPLRRRDLIGFAVSLLLVPVVGTQYLPAGSRDQFFVKVWLPEGSPIERSSEVVRRVEGPLLGLSPLEDRAWSADV